MAKLLTKIADTWKFSFLVAQEPVGEIAENFRRVSKNWIILFGKTSLL